jgi:hypothetical protein
MSLAPVLCLESDLSTRKHPRLWQNIKTINRGLMKNILFVFVLLLNVLALAAPAKNDTPLSLAQMTQGMKHFKNMDQAYTVLNLFGPRIGLEKWIAYFDKNHADLKKISFEGLRVDGNKLYLPNFKEPITVGNDKKTFTYKGVDFVFEGDQTPEQNFKRFKTAWGGNKEFAARESTVAPWFLNRADAQSGQTSSLDESMAYMPIFGAPSMNPNIYDVIKWLFVDVIAGAASDVDKATQFQSMWPECHATPPYFYQSMAQEAHNYKQIDDAKVIEKKEVPASVKRNANSILFDELKCKGDESAKIIDNLSKLCKAAADGDSTRLRELELALHSGVKTPTEKKKQKLLGEPVSGAR